MKLADYRKSSDGLRDAWFAYKLSDKPVGTKASLQSFAAGYNAAKQEMLVEKWKDIIDCTNPSSETKAILLESVEVHLPINSK